LFCKCLYYFSSSTKLDIHVVDCEIINDCAIKLPSEDYKWLSVYNRKERVPNADLECILETEETSNHKYQYHRIFSIAYYVHCSYNDSLFFYQFRRDKDCVAWFIKELRVLTHSVQSILSTNVPMISRETIGKSSTALRTPRV